MYATRKHRTAAFHGPKTDISGQETIWYWIFETRHDTPDIGTVSSYEQAVSFSMTTPLQHNISARDALVLLEKLETDAHSSPDFTPVNDKNYETFIKLKHFYHECAPFQKHPTYVRDQLQKKIKTGAQQKAGLKLQPRKVKGPQ